MRLYIDTNTFPASPALYADAEKTKPLPRILPAIELQRGGLEVAFIGSNQPQDIATVALAASIEGTQTQVVAEFGEETDDGEAWRFDFALNSESLVAEVANRGSARLRVGVIVEDDTERREWQFTTVVYPTASSGETDVEAVESAKDWAELAEQSAKDAQEAQADVAGNAQLAENAKQTAMQAANAAIEAADNAEVSERNAAESKNAAEKAKADAESAKTEAQKAANDAQAMLANVYTKSEIDGVSTGAEVTLKMNEIHAQLKDYEEVTGEKLPLDFWEAVMEEFQCWQKNPNEVKEWNTASPYDGAKEIVIDFSVVKIGAGAFPLKNVSVIFAPEVKEASSALGYSDSPRIAIFPKATSCPSLLRNTKYSSVLYFPSGVFCDTVLAYSEFNDVAILPKCSSAANGFVFAKMSAANIAKTLDCLPAWSSGTHRINFTGCPGAVHVSTTETIAVEVDGTTYTFDNFPRFTMDDENETLRYSVARATAKGWEVQMGNPQ